MCSLSPSLSSGLVLWVACLEQVNTTVDVLLSPCPSAAYWPISCHFSCFPLVCIPPCSFFTSCLGCYISGAFSRLCVLQSGAILQPLVWHSPVRLEKKKQTKNSGVRCLTLPDGSALKEKHKSRKGSEPKRPSCLVFCWEEGRGGREKLRCHFPFGITAVVFCDLDLTV